MQVALREALVQLFVRMTNSYRRKGQFEVGIQASKMLVEGNNKNHGLSIARWHQMVKRKDFKNNLSKNDN